MKYPENINRDMLKKEKARFELIKILRKMPKSKFKTELTTAIYNYSKLKIEYISTLEMEIAEVSSMYVNLEERYKLDQILFEHIFDKKITL